MKKLMFVLVFSVLVHTNVFAQNNALSFDGTDDYVNCGSAINSSIDNQITISAWVYPEFNAYGDRGIVTNYWYDAGAKGGAGIFAWQSGGGTDHIWYGMISNASGGVVSVSSSFLMALNQWTHVAMTYDNSTLRLFVNGEEVATNSCGAGYLTDPSNNNTFSIAKHSYSPNFFNGKIDEVEIWNDARSATEIRQNMYRELPNPSGETNLVAYYKFNESSGTSLADSKGSNTGTLTNMSGNEWTASMTLTGTSNALNFDGSNDYVLLDDRTPFTGLTAVTVEAWIYPTSIDGWHDIFQVFPNNIVLAFSGTSLYGYVNSNDDAGHQKNSIYGSAGLTTNQWAHVAMTWESSTGTHKLYANGIEVGSISNASTYPLVAGTAGPYIGMYAALNEMLQGSIDELRIWNDVRTPDEIRENMCKELNGNEAGLIGYYNFNQTFGSNLLDISSSDNHGTLTNMEDADWVDSESFTTWTGATSSTWAIATNWSDGVPTSTDNVGIYASANYNPTLSGSPTINSLYIASGATLSLSSGFTINDNLFLDNDLDLNGQTINFGESAELVESAGNTLTNSTGSATITMSLNNPSSQNVAGMGAEITTSANLGSTSISRGHSARSGNDNHSIYRWYSISPTNNSDLNATLVFHYDESELNGITESNLVLFRSTDGGETWTNMGGTVNTGANTITLSGISGFSTWTAGDSENPLPVMLEAFTVTIVEHAALLEWSTVLETGLAGFELYRRGDVSEEWQIIASYKNHPELAAQGGVLTGNEYFFTDETIEPMKNYSYLLVGIEVTGQRMFETQAELSTDVAFNEEVVPTKYELSPAYPNPFNPATTIKFALPENQHVRIRVFDVTGRQVAELANKPMNAGMHRVEWNAMNASSGVYFIRIDTEKFQAREKCLLVK